mgnify:CR=1 FL=1
MDVGDEVAVFLGQLQLLELRDLVELDAADVHRALRMQGADLGEGDAQVGVPFGGGMRAMRLVAEFELEGVGEAGETGRELLPESGEARALADGIAVGRPGPDRSTPAGWAPYPVLSFVLGGSPSARSRSAAAMEAV